MKEDYDQFEKYTGKKIIKNLVQKQPKLKEDTVKYVKKYSEEQVKSYYGRK